MDLTVTQGSVNYKGEVYAKGETMKDVPKDVVDHLMSKGVVKPAPKKPAPAKKTEAPKKPAPKKKTKKQGAVAVASDQAPPAADGPESLTTGTDR